MASSILIVDRDNRWTESVAEAFIPYLVCVHSVSSGDAAIAILRRTALEMVVLDAGVLSLELFCHNVCARKRPGLIVTTAVQDYRLAVDSLRAGATDVLLRPVTPKDLIARVTRQLEAKVSSPHYLGRRLDRFLKEHHQRNDLSLSMLSSTFGISSSYASLLLRDGSWGGFRARLAFHRIARAKRMLVATNEPLYLIAEQCGFASPSRLSETFSRMVGVSPKRYRVRRVAPDDGLVE